MDILQWVKSKEKQIIEMRRELHQFPELQLELPQTMKYISNKLDAMGIPYQKLVNGNAIVAIIEGKNPGKCIAIRADSDGLPIEEETGLSFASKNGNMHACGHDGHTAMALGACMVLKEHQEEFDGVVKIFFQPGEEYPGGALPMIEEGCMEDPKVEAIIGQHEGSLFPIERGKIGILVGPMMASMDRFQITVYGKGSHGAQPQKSVDPIPVASEIVMALQKIIGRELDPLEPAVVSVCQIHGGTTQNIIPDSVFMEGTVRALNEDVRKFIAKRIEEISKEIAQSSRCTAEVVYDFKYPVLVNNKEFTEFFAEQTKKILGEDSIEWIERPIMGGEDMSFFLQKAPGVFFALSNPKENNGKIYPHHSSRFDVDEKEFYKGAAAIVGTVIAYLRGGR